MPQERFDQLMKTYEHPFIKEIGEVAKRVGGHGGMDFIMDYRLIHCLRKGLPLDQDVYDAAEWSCLVELSKISVQHGGTPVKILISRGDWNKLTVKVCRISETRKKQSWKIFKLFKIKII